MSKIFAGILAVIAVGMLGAGTFAYVVWQALHSPLNIAGDSIVVQLTEGTAMSQFARSLRDRGLIEQPEYLNWYARLTGDATRIKAGEYEIPAGTTPLALMEKIVAGDVVQYSFTIIEGWTFAELLDAIWSDPVIERTLPDANSVMTDLGKPDLHAEGQFLPDTYRFPRGTTDLDLLMRSHAAMVEAVEEVWRRRSDDVAIMSPYEAIVLASIIEKETALASERREISGVFNRRLARGIRLQTDPTVIYGLGDAFDGNLRRRDILTDTPYNTYTRRGLPPTPIAMPGIASLRAAVDPSDSDALYFVATGLPDGSHVFSSTLEEHNRAVQQYLEQLRSSGE